MNKIAMAGCALLAGLAGPALATEGGGSSYSLGVGTNYSGITLPEGANLLFYYLHYGADHAKDNDGNDNRRFAYFRNRTDALALRLSYVWPGVRLAGAALETRVVLPLPSVDLDLGINRSPLTPLDRSGTASGPGDMTLAPLLFGWHGETVHQMAGLEAILPTGSYDATSPVNTGRNYRQVAAMYGVTWLPGRWEASARVRYGINNRNRATDYRSGEELSFEFSGGYRFAPGWSAGINGYVYRQLTDDSQAGRRVGPDGNRGEVDAIGPYLAWSVSKQINLIGKVQFESGARNRAEGERFWLQGLYAF